MLTKHDSVTLASNGGLAIPDLSEALPFKKEATVSAGYSDVSGIDNWNRFWTYTGINYKEFRNTLISDYVGDWATLSDADKKILVKHHVYPVSTTTGDLDALWLASERADQRLDVINLYESCGCAVLRSATANSEELILTKTDDTPAWINAVIATDTVL